MLYALLAAAVLAAPTPFNADEAPAGRRVALTDGQLFIPDGYRVDAQGFDLTLHLHGAASVSEKNQMRAGQPGVVVTVVLPGLSAVYSRKFSDPAVFRRILSESQEQLKSPDAERAPSVRRVVVTSFSAGFGGVRELLKTPESFDRIDALIMADSIYAGFEGDPAERKVSVENMAGFVHFAREAAAGRKRMLITHTELETPTYASTVDTANYLIRELRGVREACVEDWPEKLHLRTRYRRNGFELLGFDGSTGPEHMRHLHGLWLFLRRLKE